MHHRHIHTLNARPRVWVTGARARPVPALGSLSPLSLSLSRLSSALQGEVVDRAVAAEDVVGAEAKGKGEGNEDAQVLADGEVLNVVKLQHLGARLKAKLFLGQRAVLHQLPVLELVLHNGGKAEGGRGSR